MAIYTGIGGSAKSVSKIYTGVGGTARPVHKGYIGVDGVANYNIAVPAADVTAAADELPVLGTLTVTEMEVSG